MPSEGGDQERISNGPGSRPQWSPDGELVYYVGSRERSGELWALSPSDGREYLVADLKGRRGRSSWLCTDGTFLYFTWREDVGDIWVMDVVTDEDS